jgi:hypothetical protein
MKQLLRGVAVLVVALVLGVAHFLAEGGHSFADQLGGWVGKTEVAVKDVDGNAEAASHFHSPALPFAVGDVRTNDPVSETNGILIGDSEEKMRVGTDLTREEAKSLACFLTTKAVNGELSLEPPQAETEILEYIGARFTEEFPEAEERKDVADFREAVSTASSTGEATFKGALAVVCSSLHEE